MNTITLPGSWDSALAQLSLVGCAAIVEQYADPHVRVHWSVAETVAPVLSTTEDTASVAQTLIDHASRSSETWVGATHDHIGAIRGTFSPRLKAPEGGAADVARHWNALSDARCRWLASSELDLLDRRMIGALGQPGYWCWDHFGKPRPDWAASPWEMKTRNQGQEFVKDRLALLATSLADASPADVESELMGTTTTDWGGGDSMDSRTPTGLTAPRPTSSVLAWCALWGLSVMTVRPRTRVQTGNGHNHSVASGAPHGRDGAAVLPSSDVPMNLSRIRNIMRSRQFAAAAAAGTRGSVDRAAFRWLVNHGVGALAVFPREATKAKAPEEWLLEGRVVSLRDHE